MWASFFCAELKGGHEFCTKLVVKRPAKFTTSRLIPFATKAASVAACSGRVAWPARIVSRGARESGAVKSALVKKCERSHAKLSSRTA